MTGAPAQSGRYSAWSNEEGVSGEYFIIPFCILGTVVEFGMFRSTFRAHQCVHYLKAGSSHSVNFIFPHFSCLCTSVIMSAGV